MLNWRALLDPFRTYLNLPLYTLYHFSLPAATKTATTTLPWFHWVNSNKPIMQTGHLFKGSTKISKHVPNCLHYPLVQPKFKPKTTLRVQASPNQPLHIDSQRSMTPTYSPSKTLLIALWCPQASGLPLAINIPNPHRKQGEDGRASTKNCNLL